jgi:Fe-S cluster assembly protein SufD
MPDTLTAPASLASTAPIPNAELPQWFAGRATAAWTTFESLPIPSVKDEHWRYSNAKRLDPAAFHRATSASEASEAEAVAASIGLTDTAARFVFVNDQLVQADTHNLPSGVICETFTDALIKHPEVVQQHFMQREAALGSAKFAALHLAHVQAGVVIIVPKNVVVESPIEVFHWIATENAAIFPHTLIVTGDNAVVTVVDHYRSLGDIPAFSCAVADFVAQSGSRITYAHCQEFGMSATALHLSSTSAHRDTIVKSFQVQLGASFSRSESISDLLGQGSRSDMISIALPTGSQVVDQRTLQHHVAPNTGSDLLYKNALYDTSRTIFAGLITVDEGAHFTDAYQTCRNLINSEEAEANSMPGLEINADQVKCSHGSTSSPVSDEELFYLKARGINDHDARKLIVQGFLEDTLSRLDHEPLRHLIEQRIESKLAAISA